MAFRLTLLLALISFVVADPCGAYNGSCYDCTMNGCRFCHSSSYAVPPICTSLTNPTSAGCIDTNEGGTGDLVITEKNNKIR